VGQSDFMDLHSDGTLEAHTDQLDVIADIGADA
jgi:hypothetical protein